MNKPINILNVYKVLSSETRLKIINLLIKNNKPLSIFEISKKLPQFDYSSIWQHIQILNKYGFIEIKKEEHIIGKPCIIILNDQVKDYLKELR